MAAVTLMSVVVVNWSPSPRTCRPGRPGVGLLAGWYGQVVAVLRYLMRGFAAVGVAAVLAHPDWPRLFTASLVPALSLRPGVVTGGLALFGTTLTSYGATALLTNPAKSRAQHCLRREFAARRL